MKFVYGLLFGAAVGVQRRTKGKRQRLRVTRGFVVLAGFAQNHTHHKFLTFTIHNSIHI